MSEATRSLNILKTTKSVLHAVKGNGRPSFSRMCTAGETGLLTIEGDKGAA